MKTRTTKPKPTSTKAAKAALESSAAIQLVDDILAGAGLRPGARRSRRNTWAAGERKPVGRAKKLAEQKSRPAKAALQFLRAPLLEKSDAITHGFSTRSGGVTRVYRPELPKSLGDLNLGLTSHDKPENVAENRRRVLASLAGRGAKSWKLVTLKQKHTPVVRVLRDEEATALTGDAVLTSLPHRLLGVQVADCVPVLLFDPKQKAIGVFHAGWRGTLKRILERGVGTMRLEFGSKPKDLIAAIGPSIGPCCYSVGDEVRFEFASQFAYVDDLFSEVFESDPIREKYPLLFLTARAPGHSPIGPQTHLDLWEANRRQLLDAGLQAKNIHVAKACTSCNPSELFSHRSERGFTGRMMGLIGLN